MFPRRKICASSTGRPLKGTFLLSLLRPLVKCTPMYGKSTEDPGDFPKASGVIRLVRNTQNMRGGYKCFPGHLVRVGGVTGTQEYVKFVLWEGPSVAPSLLI